MNKICLACRKSFVPTKGNLKKGMGKFCSRECYWGLLRGRKLPSSTKEKIKNSIIKRWESGSFKGTTGMEIRRKVYPIIICRLGLMVAILHHPIRKKGA